MVTSAGSGGWGGTDTYGWAPGGGMAGGPGSGGGVSDPASDRRPPKAPREFMATVVGDFTIKVEWKDHGAPGELSYHPVFVQTWEVRACPINLAGSQGGDPRWKYNVLDKSHVIASMPSTNRGQMISTTITDNTLQDSYIQVVGYSVDMYTRGVPTEPLLIFADGVLPTGNLNNVTSNLLVFSSVQDNYGNQFVSIDSYYKPPVDFGRFYGMALMGRGYLGTGDLQQFGDLMLCEPTQTGVIQRNTTVIASDRDLWHGGYTPAGVVHATNGSTGITRVSGSSFTTGGAWDLKSLAIIGSGFVKTINNVTNGNALVLTSNYTGITGDYNAVVLNPMVFYFVSVDRAGGRAVDPTTSPSLSRTEGMFFL